MNIFIGNLNYSSNEDTLRELFEPFGAIDTVKIITDRDTGRSRGFGFVEMSNDDEAQAAIDALDGRDYDGRNIKVNESRPRTDRRNSGGGGGRPPRRSNY